MKTCRKCKKSKSISEFGKLHREPDGLNPWCKPCKQAQEKKHYHRPHAKAARREQNLKRWYGITQKDVDNLLEVQGNKCAICLQTFKSDIYDRSYRVDHNHTTGAVRGLLCGPCNMAIGQFYENQDYLLNAVQYLRKHNNGNR